MDFLENAVNKAKEVFDVAYKKTEDVVNTGKQKLDVANLENKLNKDYQKLGEIYFELIKESDDLQDVTLELKNAICEKQEKIAKIKKELNDAKNKRICPVCSVSIDKNAVFCSACGAKLEFEE